MAQASECVHSMGKSLNGGAVECVDSMAKIIEYIHSMT